MEQLPKNIARGMNRTNSRNTPVKSVPPRVKNQYIRANMGSTPIRKIHDCLGQTYSRGDNWHNISPKKNDVREEPPIYSERSSVLSMSTMTTLNNGKRLNLMTACDPIHGIKFIVREFKQRLKAFYPGDEIFYQMISEIGYLVKRVEYGAANEEMKPKQYVEKVIEKCSECEAKGLVMKQMEEDLTDEKEHSKSLSLQIIELETKITMKENDIIRLEKELAREMEQAKKLQEIVTEKKLYDESWLTKFDEYNKKLHGVTQDLFKSQKENDMLVTKLRIKTQLFEDLQKDLDQIHEINNQIMQNSSETRKDTVESEFGIARRSSTDLSYKADENFMKLFVLKTELKTDTKKQDEDDQESLNSISTISFSDVCRKCKSLSA